MTLVTGAVAPDQAHAIGIGEPHAERAEQRIMAETNGSVAGRSAAMA
jgi:hypothetical protein